MTCATDFQAKVEKTATNMDRLDTIINGPVDGSVAIDGGVTIPTLQNLFAHFGGGGGAGVTGEWALGTPSTGTGTGTGTNPGTGTGTYVPALKFNDARNSQYL